MLSLLPELRLSSLRPHTDRSAASTTEKGRRGAATQQRSLAEGTCPLALSVSVCLAAVPVVLGSTAASHSQPEAGRGQGGENHHQKAKGKEQRSGSKVVAMLSVHTHQLAQTPEILRAIPRDLVL